MAARVPADKPFFDALLAEKSSLWPAIMRCNAHPRLQAHKLSVDGLLPSAVLSLETWLAGMPDSGRPAIEPGECGFFWDFSESSRKLALLDDTLLGRLASVTGVTLHAKDLARIVGREERIIVREALGTDLFSYAQVRGQYMAGSAAALVARWDTELPLPERCRAHGWLTLYYCSLRWPRELRRVFHPRLARLSAACGVSLNPGDALDEVSWRALWRLVKKCLLHEVAPSWEPYFTA